jgi:DNA (cytosine-5)-methyltransferase 1
MGYHQAGFDVIGVDINPQPRYPFRFVQGDALDVLAGWDLMQPFDAIHASPPCQAYSALRTMPGVGKHPELVDVTRRALERTGVPWVIENVPGAPLRDPLKLCGSEFGLTVRCRPDGRLRWLKRHRLFESNRWLVGAGGCHCTGWPIAGVYGHGGGASSRRGWQVFADEAREVMGCGWMNRDEVSQAIPPAYTRFIGEQLIEQLSLARAS